MPETTTAAGESPDEDISLADLRAGAEQAWAKAEPFLWKRAYRAIVAVLPNSTESEREDLVGDVLCGRPVKGQNKEAAEHGEPKFSPGVVSKTIHGEPDSFHKANTFDDILNLTTAAATARAIDYVRSNSIRDLEENQDRVAEINTQRDDVGDQVAHAELFAHILEAAALLPDRQRAVFIDRYILGRSPKEISEAREIPYGTVLSDLHYARQSIAQYLRDRGHDDLLPDD